MVSGNITVMGKHGLHMRPAKELCQVAADYKCKITLVSGDTKTNAKSLLNVLGAGIKEGTSIQVICEGEDEDEALAAVINILSEVKEN